MGKILCATRGGEASVRTQDAAISKAKETGDELVFLYIYDMDFMAHAKYALRSDVVTDELDRMAEFLMTMAVERAQKKGIDARYVIRQGEFAEELVAAAQEEQAALVILGCPEEQNNFQVESLRDLVDRLQAETGIPFSILPEGSVKESV